MSQHRRFALAACLALICGAASPPPTFLPTRDVTVDYVVSPHGEPEQRARVGITAGAEHVRLESDAVPGPVLIDRATATALLVYPPAKLFTVLPSRGVTLQGLLAQGDPQFTRLGEARVAGLACTEYRIVARQGSGTGCLTEDGVLLRGSGRDTKGKQGAIVATSVRYGALPAAEFSPPAGYQELPRGALAALIPGLGR